jgi:hypothetical protein
MDEIRRIVTETRQAQGLPEKVTDPAALSRLADLIVQGDGHPSQNSPSLRAGRAGVSGTRGTKKGIGGTDQAADPYCGGVGQMNADRSQTFQGGEPGDAASYGVVVPGADDPGESPERCRQSPLTGAESDSVRDEIEAS